MTPIPDILHPANVQLTLEADSENSAVEEVMALLEGDAQVRNFADLQEAVRMRAAAAIVENGCGICIAHGRVESVSSLVMAAGRSLEGIPAREGNERVNLFFVAGIPRAFNAEYLRIVGAIARICRDRQQVKRLLTVKTARQFVDLLGTAELKL